MLFRLKQLMSRFHVVALALMFAVTVAGCGGGGSTSTADMDGDGMAMPGPMPTPAELLATAQEAVDTAQMAVDGFTATTTPADRAVAYSALAKAQAALAEAEGLPDNVLQGLRDQVTALATQLTDATNFRAAIDAVNAARMEAAGLDADSDQAAIDAARTLVTAAQTAVSALDADDSARLSSQVSNANYMVMAAQTRLDKAATVAADTKAAGTKGTALSMEAEQEADAGLGGTGTPMTTDNQNAGEYNLSIKHGETSITVEGGTEDDDVKFMQAMDFGDGRTMHTREMEADADGNVMTEVAVVSTDIEAPKATAFAGVHDLGVNPKTENGMDFQSVAIGQDNLAMVATTGIAATGAGTITVLAAVEDDDQTADDETVAAFETDATFDGAAGTLKCAGAADCTVTLDADGEITAFGIGWQFTPDADVTVDVADVDYLHYGFWLKKTADSDGATTYNEVETLAGSSLEVSTATELGTVEGSAIYSGGAVGVYVKSVTNSDGTEVSATSGHFKADASLTAYFSGTSVAEDLHDTVTGTIDNFVLQHGEENAWSVALKGVRDAGESTISGTANGGGAAGMFSGTYHGLTPETEADTDGNARVAPGSVVGEFNANFSNGSVAGGFGARKK